MPMPSSLRLSLLAWALAVIAGVAETVLAVSPEIASGEPVLDLLPCSPCAVSSTAQRPRS